MAGVVEVALGEQERLVVAEVEAAVTVVVRVLLTNLLILVLQFMETPVAQLHLPVIM